MNSPQYEYELPQMKYPLQQGVISVIVPIYNTAQYLRECLDSLLNQSFQSWEAILVNDGSPDDSQCIIDEYVAKDSRFGLAYIYFTGAISR